MASITFSGLQNIQTVNKYDFVDLHLDFNKPVQRDVAVDYDQAAIAVSYTHLTLPTIYSV